MITWLLTSLIDWVASLILTLLNWLVLAVSSNVGLSGDETFQAMQDAFPILEEFYPGIVTCGLFISFMICMFQVFKALFGPLAEAESPVTLVCRTVGFIVLVAFSSTICSIFIDIGTAPYQWITETMESYDDELRDGAWEVEEFAGAFTNPDAGEDAGGLIAGAALFAAMPGLAGLLIIIMLVMIVKKYFALLMEVVERYVILGFLVFIAPLCIATGASRATNFVFKGWIQMMLSQIILMCFGLLFLAVSNEAIVTWLKAWVGGGTGDGVAKNPIMMFLLLMSWLRIGQNVDNYMSSLGLKAAHAGGGLGNDIMAGVSQGMPIANAVSNKMLGTNYGQPGGFKSAAHELFGSAAKKNAIKAGGHNLGIASPGSMKNALKNASGGKEKLAAMASMGRNSNSLISPKGLTDAGKQQSAQKSLDAMMNQGVNAAAGSKTGMTDIGATALGLTGSGVNLDESKTSMKDGVMHLEGTDANGKAFSADIAKTGAKEAENGVPILDAKGNPTGYSMVGGEINDADLQKQLLGDNAENAANAGLAAGDTTTSQPGAPEAQQLSDNKAIDGVNFEGENGEKLHMDEDGVLRDGNEEVYNGAVSMTDAEGNSVTANALNDDGTVGAALKTDENGNLVVKDGKFQTEDGKAVDGDHVVGQSLDTQTAADGTALVGAQDYKGDVNFQDGDGNNVQAFKTDDNGDLVKGDDGNAVPLTANADGTFTDSDGNKVDDKNVGFSADGGNTTVDKNGVQAMGNIDGEAVALGKGADGQFTAGGQALTANYTGDYDGKIGFQDARTGDALNARALNDKGVPTGENLKANADGTFSNKAGDKFTADQVGFVSAGSKNNGNIVDSQHAQAVGSDGQKLGVGANGQYTTQKSENITKDANGNFVGMTTGNAYSANQLQGVPTSQGKSLYGVNQNGDLVAATKSNGKYVDSNGNALSNVQAYGGTNGAKQLSGYSVGADGSVSELKRNDKGQWVGADGKAVSNPVMAASGMGSDAAVYGQNSKGEMVKGKLDSNGNVVSAADGKTVLTNASVYTGMGGASQLSGYSIDSKGQAHELKQQNGQWVGADGKAVSNPVMAPSGHDGSFAYGKTGDGSSLALATGTGANGARTDAKGNTLSGVSLYSGSNVTGAATMEAGTGKAVATTSMAAAASLSNNASVAHNSDSNVKRYGMDSNGNAVQVFANDQTRTMTGSDGKAIQLSSQNGTFVGNGAGVMSAGDARVGFQSADGKTNLNGSDVSANYSYSSKTGEALTPVSKNAQGVYENVSPNADGTFSVGNRTIPASNVQFRDSNGQVGTQSAASAISSGSVNVSGGDKLTDKNTGASANAVLVAPAGSYVSADNKTVETASSAFANVGSLGANDTLRSGSNGYYVENSADNSHKSSLQMYGNVDGRSVPLQASSGGGYEYMGNDGRMQSYSGAVSALNDNGQYTNRVSADDAGMTLSPGTMVKTSNSNMDSAYTTSLNSQGTHVMDTSGNMHEVAASSISSGGGIVSNNGEITLANGSTINAASVATNNDGSIQGFSVASASFGKTESGSGQVITLGEAKTIAGTGETYYQIGNSGQYISASAFERAGGNSVSGEGYQTYSQSTPLVAEGKDGSYHGVSSDCMRYNANNEPCANGEFMRDSNTNELFHTTGNVYAGKERTLETGVKPDESYVPSTNPTHAAIAGGGYVALQSSQRYDANGNKNNDGDYYKAVDGSQIPVTQGGYEVAYSVGGIKSDADGRITIPAGATINKNDNGTVSFHAGGTEYKIHPAGTYDKSSNKDAVSIGDGRIITQQNHQYERACSWAEQGNRPDGIYHGAEAQSMAAAIGIDPRNVKSAGISQDKKQVAIVMNDNTARVYSSQGSIGYGHRVEGGVHMTPVDKTSLPKGTPSISIGRSQSGSDNVKSVGSAMRTAHTIRDKDFEAQQQEEKNSKPRKNKK